VKYVLPRTAEFPGGFVGGTVEERYYGLQNTMQLLAGDPTMREAFDFESHINELGDAGYASDLSSFYIIANSRLVRRVRAPAYVDARVKSIRTGGFAELLTESTVLKIPITEVIEKYCELEGVSKEENSFSKEHLESMKRVLKQLFKVDIFTSDEDESISLIVPGGGIDGLSYPPCCVDVAVFNFLKLEEGEEQALDIMRRTRVRFVDLYVKWREGKKGRKRKRDGVPNVPTSNEDAKIYMRDLNKATKHGYSSHIFKYFQTAVYCESGYLPCIYYHRLEKARDYNQGVRSRMVQVGGGVLMKELDSRNERYKPINMLRITLDGVIHKHKPKGLCEEETSTFIPDDESTGLLHAITVHPSLSCELFKGPSMKKREAVLSLVEQKTTTLMSYYRRAAVGMVEVDSSMMESLVADQLRRQGQGITKTLIYYPKNAENDELSASNEPAHYFSNCYDLQGRKIPDRPLVIAYDLETVELTPECVASGMVGEEFLRENPDSSKYIECERQIPYCVSWVPINLSDEGRHKRLKEEGGGSVNGAQMNYFTRREEEWCQLAEESNDMPRWENRHAFVFCPNKRRVRVGYIMLDEAKVHYGGYILGRCINEFAQSVVAWAMMRGYTSVYAYAHNGVGFDSYVVQAFNSVYEYQSILKTSRGILSMRMKVPFVTSDSKRRCFPVNFLDTKVFLSFPLSQLCRDFNVPEVWSKLDFPITKITWKNCYDPDWKMRCLTFLAQTSYH
jgi:hypothetical protein